MIIPSEDSPKFHERMRQSMAVSFYKYGPVKEAFPHKVKAIKSLEKRLQLYKETGNADYLVDISNFAMIEFMLPDHPKFHDAPTDGGEGRYWQNGGPSTEKNNDGERF